MEVLDADILIRFAQQSVDKIGGLHEKVKIKDVTAYKFFTNEEGVDRIHINIICDVFNKRGELILEDSKSLDVTANIKDFVEYNRSIKIKKIKQKICQVKT